MVIQWHTTHAISAKSVSQIFEFQLMGLQVDSISCSIIGPFADYEFRTDRDLMIDTACSLEEDEGSLCIKIRWLPALGVVEGIAS